jgi:hypothetical protein
VGILRSTKLTFFFLNTEMQLRNKDYQSIRKLTAENIKKIRRLALCSAITAPILRETVARIKAGRFMTGNVYY